MTKIYIILVLVFFTLAVGGGVAAYLSDDPILECHERKIRSKGYAKELAFAETQAIGDWIRLARKAGTRMNMWHNAKDIQIKCNFSKTHRMHICRATGTPCRVIHDNE